MSNNQSILVKHPQAKEESWGLTAEHLFKGIVIYAGSWLCTGVVTFILSVFEVNEFLFLERFTLASVLAFVIMVWMITKKNYSLIALSCYCIIIYAVFNYCYAYQITEKAEKEPISIPVEINNNGISYIQLCSYGKIKEIIGDKSLYNLMTVETITRSGTEFPGDRFNGSESVVLINPKVSVGSVIPIKITTEARQINLNIKVIEFNNQVVTQLSGRGRGCLFTSISIGNPSEELEEFLINYSKPGRAYEYVNKLRALNPRYSPSRSLFIAP